MAWTFALITESGTDSINLNDGTFYHIAVGGFAAPPPPVLTNYSGGNIQRHGEDLLGRVYGNRTVSVGLTVKANDASTLGQKIMDVEKVLRWADEWSRKSWGTRVQLRYQWEGQTGTYLFNVIEGSLDLGDELHGPYMLKGTRIHNARLNLICEPFVTQPSETLQNWLKDPSFEMAGSALANWTASLGTATGTRVASNAKWGTASLRVLKATAGGANTADYSQLFVSPGTAAFSASIWGTLSGSGTARLLLLWKDNAGAQVGSNEASSTAGTFQITLANATPPGSAPTGTLQYVLRQVVGDTQTGTIYWDNGYLATATSLPTAWVSGRDIASHFDDNGQAHTNYLDIYNVPGDQFAPMQAKILETEAHDEIWVGINHAPRQTATAMMLEGENFAASGWGSASETNDSNTLYGLFTPLSNFNSTSASSPQVATSNIGVPPTGQFRVLVRAYARTATATSTVMMGLGYRYGGVTKDPSTASHYASIRGTAQELYDLGVLTIPPLKTPQGGTVGTFAIRLAFYQTGTAPLGTQTPQIDYVMLMPIDDGGIYGSKDSATDNLWIDSLSRVSGLYRISTADIVQSFPASQQGTPPVLSPRGSRLYFLFGSATSSIGHGATVSISYVPRYLQVGT